jgi:hypothetical protein
MPIKTLFSTIALLLSLSMISSGQAFFKNFDVRQFADSVSIDWTISAGNSCNNMEVQRSEDSINFQRIAIFSGVCGNEEVDELYGFFDKGPFDLAKEYYYRIWASNGLVISDVVAIRYFYLPENIVILAPNPADGDVAMLFNNPENKAHKLTIFDLSGRQVLTIEDQRGNTIEIDAEGLSRGVFVVQLSDEERVIATRRVVVP